MDIDSGNLREPKVSNVPPIKDIPTQKVRPQNVTIFPISRSVRP
jgi:hypothetical protein